MKQALLIPFGQWIGAVMFADSFSPIQTTLATCHRLTLESRALESQTGLTEETAESKDVHKIHRVRYSPPCQGYPLYFSSSDGRKKPTSSILLHSAFAHSVSRKTKLSGAGSLVHSNSGVVAVVTGWLALTSIGLTRCHRDSTQSMSSHLCCSFFLDR